MEHAKEPVLRKDLSVMNGESQRRLEHCAIMFFVFVVAYFSISKFFVLHPIGGQGGLEHTVGEGKTNPLRLSVYHNILKLLR